MRHTELIVRTDSARMQAVIEQYFRDEIRKAWQVLESAEGKEAYAVAFVAYCRLLGESSEYASSGKLPHRLVMKKTADAR